jgi:DNA-directed RNA polymerase subunit RPC12/RpoP
MKMTNEFTIDLTKIEGDGDFLCPSCGSKISPDDESEEIYTILEPRVNSRGLEEVVIRCNRCSSHIQLTGFSTLEKND